MALFRFPCSSKSFVAACVACNCSVSLISFDSKLSPPPTCHFVCFSHSCFYFKNSGQCLFFMVSLWLNWVNIIFFLSRKLYKWFCEFLTVSQLDTNNNFLISFNIQGVLKFPQLSRMCFFTLVCSSQVHILCTIFNKAK